MFPTHTQNIKEPRVYELYPRLYPRVYEHLAPVGLEGSSERRANFLDAQDTPGPSPVLAW